MKRYFDAGNREFILLKSYPCIHGKCTFCRFHLDNSCDTPSMLKINRKVISQIKGKYGILEVYNSGSIFELPVITLFELRERIQKKSIRKIITEAHWIYRQRFEEMKKFFGIEETIIKVGVETFDNDLREKSMKKGMGFVSPEEIRSFTNGINLLVGFKGQTRAMVRNDMEIACKFFDYVDINILDEKHVPEPEIVDRKLIEWFLKNFAHFEQGPNFRIFRRVDEIFVSGAKT